MAPTQKLSQLPDRQKAIVALGAGQLAIKHNAPVPVLNHDMVLVKAATVTVNPVDVKSLDYSPAPGVIMGFDFAGTIVALGSDAAAAGRLAVGDRVAGVVYGMDRLQPDVGAFAQYVGALADLVLKMPDHMSFEDAAALGLATATAAYGLFNELQLAGSLDSLIVGAGVPRPGDFVLVAGGSTATGTRAIELLKTYAINLRIRDVFIADLLLQCWLPPHRHLLPLQLRARQAIWRREGLRLSRRRLRRSDL